MPRTRLGPKKSHRGDALKKWRRGRGEEIVEAVAKDGPEDLLE